MALRKRRKADGFTMIEVIAVLLIIGITAAIAVARIGDTSIYDVHSQVEVIKSHLRYAQSRAMATGKEWGVKVTSETTYYLFDGADSDTPVRFLGENDPTVDLAAKHSGVTIAPDSQTVTFDAYGSPGDTTLTLTVTGAGGRSMDITVTKNTGYIP
ncbi:MAG: hypothetical protein AVO39_01815 [delta proteobacterium MLS_D]|jgi:prepilin-type N-terminal cleavage/methylation domain-containing protein|nr:MAG: hypothetical protein AVO39_01815 [delta proteobacterium MLS_D]